MKRLIAAALTATVLPLAACTSTATSDPATSTVPDTATLAATGTSTPDPVESWLSGPSTTAAPPASTLTVETTGSPTVTSTSVTAATEDAYDAIPVTIPDSITGARLKAAKAGITVWRNAVRLYDESMQDPSANWNAKIRKYVADPAAITQLSLVAALAQDGAHQIGETRFDAWVSKATEHSVLLAACVDVSHSDVIGRDGQSITGDGPVKFQWSFNIDYYPGPPGRWLLNYIDKPKPSVPC